MSQKAAQSSSETTGLPNRQAFDDGKVSPFVAVSDVKNLKPNERFGHAVGDILLHRLAEVFISVGLDAYHDLGGTLLCRGESYEDLNLKLSQARQILRQPLSVGETDGRIHTIEGADFCFAIGTTLEEAQLALKRQKQIRAPEKAKSAGQKV